MSSMSQISLGFDEKISRISEEFSIGRMPAKLKIKTEESGSLGTLRIKKYSSAEPV